MAGLGLAAVLLGLVCAASALSRPPSAQSGRPTAQSGRPTAQSRRCQGQLLLPDLVALVPDHIDVKQVGTPNASQFLLVFQTGVANKGAGPLTLVGERANTARPNLPTRQLIDCSAGPPESRAGAGVMLYTNEPTHDHWHYLDFERYELRALGGGAAARRSRKAGFCPGDVARVVLTVPDELAHTPAGPVFGDQLPTICGAGNPAALRVAAGISVGYADLYAAFVEGQFIDLTGLSAGTYRLTNQANPLDHLLEQRYDNDVAGIDVTLSWPHGPQSKPSIALGASCMGRGACGA